MRPTSILYTFAALGALGCSPNAGDQDLSDIDAPAALAAAEAQARRVGEALLAGDWNSFADYTHPKVLEKMGGRAKMKATIKAGLEDMKQQGIGFHAVRIGRPDRLFRAKGDLFTIVPQRVVMSTRKAKLRQDGFLLGISSDNGISWTFIDGAGTKKMDIREIVPHIPDNLKLPHLASPVLDENDE